MNAIPVIAPVVGGVTLVTLFTFILRRHMLAQPPDSSRRACENCAETLMATAYGWRHVQNAGDQCNTAMARPKL